VACPPTPVCTDSRVLPPMSNAFIRFLTAMSEAVGRTGLPFKSFAPSHADRSQRGASRQYGTLPACHCQWRTVHRERYSLFALFKGLAVGLAQMDDCKGVPGSMGRLCQSLSLAIGLCHPISMPLSASMTALSEAVARTGLPSASFVPDLMTAPSMGVPCFLGRLSLSLAVAFHPISMASILFS
jgi:hypothetical protein